MNTARLEVAPMQWADLKSINDVEPVNDGDLECMAEVREVLKRHGKRDRFGLALLHKHFEMNDGEVLVEDSDEETRELSIKPVRHEAVAKTVPTIWMLLDEESRPVQYCKADGHRYTGALEAGLRPSN